MTDYSKMTDAELNRAVAKALGWDAKVFPATIGERIYWSVTQPDGSRISYRSFDSQQLAWTGLAGNLPAYSTDANLALSLIGGENDFGVTFTLSQSDVRGLCHTCLSVKGTPIATNGTMPQAFARAICIAFLSAQEEGK